MRAHPLALALPIAAVAGAAGAQVGSPGSGYAASLPRPIVARLAGDVLPSAPHFQYVRAFHELQPTWAALDPTAHPDLVGTTVDLWIVPARDTAAWQADPLLVDARGMPQPVVIQAGSLTANLWMTDGGTLSGDAGAGFGVGYDVVLDTDRDGRLGARDLIDGYGDEAGFYVVRDVTQPGPLAVTEIKYSGGTFLGQDLYYPTSIAALGLLPLVVVSHGNGHNYQWYDHIGFYLASYGCVVMSHENNTQPGIGAASTTTLTNTDYLLGNLDTIAGGALAGHVDGSRIAWIGHSRGGEGVVRAYKRLKDGLFTAQNFSAGDLQFLSSMAPVTFLSSDQSTPEAVPYHLFFGGADNDVKGTPTSCCKPQALYERAIGPKSHVYIHGMGHGWFHSGPMNCVCAGPDLISRPEAHKLVLGYFLPLVKYYFEREYAALDFIQRPYDDFGPPGVDPTIVVAKEHRERGGAQRFVVDDFELHPDTAVSSSGGRVAFNVNDLVEGRMEDFQGLAWDGSQPMNGMTRTVDGLEDHRGVVFDWEPSQAYFVEFELVPDARDLTQRDWLMFRACQGTRHPENEAWNAPITFTVTLRDTAGTTSSIDIGAYGAVTRTYQRGPVVPPGWVNEFTTFRLRIADFARDGNGLELSSIAAVRFEFGPGFGADRGRLGFDDLELVRD